MIKQLSELKGLLDVKKPKGLAVACAQDENTIQAIYQAARDGYVIPYMIGNKEKIEDTIDRFGMPQSLFKIIDTADDVQSAQKAVELVKSGEADILMKGLLSTAVYLKAILDKEKGLLPKGNILSHITVIQLPLYRKLLFLTDVAVIPLPTLEQKAQMIEYALKVTSCFGIEKPIISLLSATEKPTDKLPGSVEARKLTEQFRAKYGERIVIDGPLDVFLSLDPDSIRIKEIPTPVNGDADILIFPNIESGNAFYKLSVLMGQGKVAAILAGTTHPVILTSRSDNTESKYYSILFGCLMS